MGSIYPGLVALLKALLKPCIEKVNKAEVVIVDTAVKEKNITVLTDAKLYRKVISQCNHIVKRCGIKLRQMYKIVVQRLQCPLV